MGFSYKQLLQIFFPPSPDELLFTAASPSQFHPARRQVHKQTTALLTYQDPAVRAAIHLAKFHHHEAAIATLGTVLSAHLRQEPARALVPIPLSKKRYRERGYNQVVEIITAAGRAGLSVPCTSLLVRTRHTNPQANLDRASRLTNVTGAFSLNRTIAQNVARDIPLLVIDDVSTTGATLTAARETLLAGGFRDVECLAIAH